KAAHASPRNHRTGRNVIALLLAGVWAVSPKATWSRQVSCGRWRRVCGRVDQRAKRPRRIVASATIDRFGTISKTMHLGTSGRVNAVPPAIPTFLESQTLGPKRLQP